MRSVRLLIFFAAVTCAFAQASSGQVPSDNRSTAVVAVPSKPKKPAKPKPETDKPRYFVEVHQLHTSNVGISGANCYEGDLPLNFPASNAAEVAKALASERGYTFAAISPDKIAIYYKSTTSNPPRLAEIEIAMDKLAASDFSNAKAVRIPVGTADKVLKQLTPPSSDAGLVVTAVGEKCVLILSKNQPNPVTIASLSKSLPGLYWRQESTPPTFRLFHLDAPTLVKKLEGVGDSGGDKTIADSSASGKSDSAAKPASGASGGNTSAQNLSVSVAASGNPTDSTDGGDQADDSTGAKDGDGKAAPSDKFKADAAKKDTPTAPKPPAMKAVNDMLVYSNDDGSDRGFFERNRLMAVLDLPRPEVLMNVWSLQASSHSYTTVTNESEAARELVAHHNQALEDAIENGWSYLSLQMKHRDPATGRPDFFNPGFYNYVTKKFAETTEPRSELATLIGLNRRNWGWCGENRYCLGFTHAFEPLRPTFTNILMGLIAADNPRLKAHDLVAWMSGDCGNLENTSVGGCKNAKVAPQTADTETDEHGVHKFDGCMREELKKLATFKKQTAAEDCEVEDRIELTEQIRSQQKAHLRLNCFESQARQSFDDSRPSSPGPVKTTVSAVSRVGLLRAAVADFLFNYKWSLQYPHDFVPYDLTQSAQELNAEFNPLVLAFNRDVSAFTENLQSELQCKYQANFHRHDPWGWFRPSDETFINDGMISVRGISGLESIVDTATQSFFDATKPPSLTDLVKSVSDAENNIPGVLKTNLSANEAAVLLGALNSVKPAQAKIGRGLKLDITPHALAGASSAELEVKLTADEAGNPTLFKADKQEEDTLSRVAKHDTTTRVRVESLKLFEVSAFSATLQRPRSKFPVLPPFFEVPYLGSFIGWPLPGTNVYHRSTAIVSAIIVPTATDLAFGIEFVSDRLCDETRCHAAHSPYDFNSRPLRNYHKAMIQCFASADNTAYAGLLAQADRDEKACEHLALSQAPATLSKPAAGAPNDEVSNPVAVPPN